MDESEEIMKKERELMMEDIKEGKERCIQETTGNQSTKVNKTCKQYGNIKN